MKILDNKDRHGHKKFPELPDDIPFEKLNREKAYSVHSQSLERLNERGGMSILELILNLSELRFADFFTKYGYNYEPKQKDVDELILLLNCS